MPQENIPLRFLKCPRSGRTNCKSYRKIVASYELLLVTSLSVKARRNVERCS